MIGASVRYLFFVFPRSPIRYGMLVSSSAPEHWSVLILKVQEGIEQLCVFVSSPHVCVCVCLCVCRGVCVCVGVRGGGGLWKANICVYFNW